MGSIRSGLLPFNHKITTTDEKDSITISNPYSTTDTTSVSEQFSSLLDKFEAKPKTKSFRNSSGGTLRQSIQNEVVEVASAVEQKMPKYLRSFEESNSTKKVDSSSRNPSKLRLNESSSSELQAIQTTKESVDTEEEVITEASREIEIFENEVSNDEVIDEKSECEFVKSEEILITPEKIFDQEQILAEEVNTVVETQIMDNHSLGYSNCTEQQANLSDNLKHQAQNSITEDPTSNQGKTLNNEYNITDKDITVPTDTSIPVKESLFEGSEVQSEEETIKGSDSERISPQYYGSEKKLVESTNELNSDSVVKEQSESDNSDRFFQPHKESQIDTFSKMETGEICRSDGDSSEFEEANNISKGKAVNSNSTGEEISPSSVKPEVHPAILSLSNSVMGRATPASAEESLSKSLPQVVSQSQLALRASGNQRGITNNATSATALPLQQQGETHRSSEEKKVPRLPPSLHSRLLDQVKKMLHDVEQLTKNGSSLSFRLDPPQLGNVHVYMRVHGGTLHARISPDNSEVVNFLKDKGGEIHESLREVGLSFEEIKVSFGGTNISHGGDNQFQGSNQHETGDSFYNQTNFLSHFGDMSPSQSAVKVQHLSSVRNEVKDYWVA